MAKLTAALFVLLAVFGGPALSAEPAPLASIQWCEPEPGKMFEMVQDKYGEQPFIQGSASIQTLQGPWLKGNFYMLMNPDTRTFSIILIDPQSGLECLWLAGGDVVPSVGDGI